MTVDGVLVCAVVKNWRSPVARGTRAAERERGWLQSSYDSYKERRFADTVAQSEQVLQLNPQSAAAYNNICAASNELGDFTHALEACSKGLALLPDDQLLRNNRSVAERGLESQRRGAGGGP